MNPIKVFGVLAALLAAIAAAALLTRPAAISPSASESATPTPEDHSLTNAEAIARFKELDAVRLRALSEKDASLLSVVFAPGSPAQQRVDASIRRLKRLGVSDETVEETQRVSVESNEASQVVLRQEVIVRSRFVDARGVDVTTGRRNELQVIRWNLSLVNGKWLLLDGNVVSATRVGRDK